MQARNRAVSGFIWLAVCTVFLSGCVAKSDFEAMVGEKDAALAQLAEVKAERDALVASKQELESVRRDLMTEKADLMKEKTDLNRQLEDSAAQKAQAAAAAEKARAEVARQQEVYQSLQQTFAKEQQQNQVRIEMLKSGVKVNLDNEILFPSGSAELNANGVDVLKRAAEELKKSTYQTLVAGFTDNVAISGKLMDRYPSNWELAGARAASVVRLLAAEGVPPEQMLAISFGENSPIASNDTPEGRKRNRRIEILLRPVPIEMR